MTLVIVTHHYVREKEYPPGSKIGRYTIKITEFEKRLDYCMRHYSIISPDMFLKHLKYGSPLPSNAMMLTFDDGYIDHYKNVFPILMDRGLKGFFFPSVKPIFEGKLLNTNKLQLIMDFEDKEKLLAEIHRIVTGICSESELKQFKSICGINNEFDSEESIWAYLEWELSLSSANRVIGALFNQLIHVNEKELCEKYYMNIKQLQYMKQNGMHIGCHGYSHYCMSRLDNKTKADEINKALRLLRLINGSKRGWVMSYPYGSYDNNLISIIKSRGCIAGITTEEAAANLEADEIYALPRIDISSEKL